MLRIAFAVGCVIALAAPAFADHNSHYRGWERDYDHNYSYERRHHRRHGSRRGYEAPAYSPYIYVPYGSYYSHYFDDEPGGYPVERRGDRFDPRKDCEIERKWRKGRLIEEVDCDD